MSEASIAEEHIQKVKRRKRLEFRLKILLVLLIILLGVGAGFLLFRYFSQRNAPPSTYYDFQIRLWQAYLEKDPKNATILTNLGYIYLKIEDFKKATWYFNKALEYNPKHVPALYNLGIYYKKTGNTKLAVTNLKAAAANAEPGSKYLAYFTLGELYQNQKEYSKAIKYYQKSLEDNATIWNNYSQLGKVYEALGKKDLALKNYQEAAKFNPDDEKLQEAIERLSK